MAIWDALPASKRTTRLLNLKAATDKDAPLIGSLTVVDLDGKPEYEAISYCWGAGRKTVAMTVSGQAHDITLNLRDALTKLRLPNKPRDLWADALSIDQGESPVALAERAAQVRMMDMIFASASTVHVWTTGRSTEGEVNKEFDYRLVERHAADPKAHIEEFPWICMDFGTGWWNRIWTVQEVILAKDVVFHTLDGSVTMEQLEKFVQALDNHIFSGRRCCVEVMNKVMISPEAVISGLNTVMDILSRRHLLNESKFDILDLRLAYLSRRSTDPKDLLFALVGMSKPVSDGFVTYQLPLAETYAHCASILMAESRTLEVLNAVEVGRPPKKDEGTFSTESSETRGIANARARLPDLPSWVADWSQRQPLQRAPGTRQLHKLNGLYSAGGSSQASPAICIDRRSLRLTGTLLDRIKKVGEIQDNPWTFPADTFKQWYIVLGAASGICDADGGLVSEDGSSRRGGKGKLMRRLLSRLIANRRPRQAPMNRIDPEFMKRALVSLATRSYPAIQPLTLPQETLFDAFRRTLLGDRKQAGSLASLDELELGATDPGDKLVFMLAWARSVCRQKEDMVIFGNEEEAQAYTATIEALESQRADQIAENVGNWMATFADRRRFLLTETGLIGLAHLDVEEGDLVAILEGGSTPYVLRPSGTDAQQGDNPKASTYTFMGGAYVHGLMNGEAAHALLESREIILQ